MTDPTIRALFPDLFDVDGKPKPTVPLTVAGAAFDPDLAKDRLYACANRGELAQGVPVLRVGLRKFAVPVLPLLRALGVDVAALLADAGDRAGR